MHTVILEKAIHKEQHVLCIKFERDPELEKVVRTLPLCTWSKTLRCWYVPNQPAHFRKVLAAFRPFAYVDFTKVVDTRTETTKKFVRLGSQKKVTPLPELSDRNRKSIEEFEQWLKSKRYSANTIKTYTEAVRTFLRFSAKKNQTKSTMKTL